jgi:hypothetical protein
MAQSVLRQVGRPGYDFHQGQDFSLLYSVQTGSGAHTASYPEREADHSLPSSADVKNDGAIPPLPHMFLGYNLSPWPYSSG